MKGLIFLSCLSFNVYSVDNIMDLKSSKNHEVNRSREKTELLRNPQFKGKKISLNFQNINIRAVLQILADFVGMNLVVSDKVHGFITLNLNNIAWDEALNIILSSQGLSLRRKGRVLLIDTKFNRDKMEKALLKNRQVIQKLEPMHSVLLQVNYAKASDLAVLIKDQQRSLLSEQGKISVDIRTNKIWILDKKVKLKEIRDLIKHLDVPVKQVSIEARIVQVSKDFSRDIGIKWGISQPSVLEPVEDEPIGHFANKKLNLDLISTPISLAKSSTLGIALAKINDNILLDLELSALESEGKAQLISSPRLITINQQPALIESGQEIPYQESTSSGATAVSFKKAVLSLKVTPQITPDNRILMSLQINQDTTSAHTFNGVPSIFTKEIQTHVLVNNGQTIVLGGIYTQNKTKDINRIPLLGSLPLLGVLFSNKKMNVKNDELLIFITTRLLTNDIPSLDVASKNVYN